MNNPRRKWLIVLLTIVISLVTLIGGGYLFLQYKIGEIKEAISGSKLENENYRIFTVQTDTTAHSFRNEIISLNGLEIGNVRFRNTGALIVENPKYGMLNCISPYGIIGYNILQNCYWQIDYQKKKITITDKIDSLPNLNNTKWIGYTTISQETPIIPAVLNDSINVNLFFDTRYSGAINLSSSQLYKTICENHPELIAKYSVKPCIVISGGKDDDSYIVPG